MADVFISYARPDRGLAEGLAKDLSDRGFSVWWDAELLSSDNFQDVILAELSNAKAAIVLWTSASTKSNFVRDEARYALHCKKLVATKVSGLSIMDIPFGFQSQHTDDIGARENIIRTLEKLGVKPSEIPSSASDPSWERVREAGNLSEILAWIGANQSHRLLKDAVALAQKLADAPQSISVRQPQAPHASSPIVRRNSFHAFLRGLTLQIPKFQLSEEGVWTSIGSALLLTTLCVPLLLWIFARVEPFYAGWLLRLDGVAMFGGVSIHALLALGASYWLLSRWVATRNYWATVVAIVPLTTSMVVTLYLTLIFFLTYTPLRSTALSALLMEVNPSFGGGGSGLGGAALWLLALGLTMLALLRQLSMDR